MAKTMIQAMNRRRLAADDGTPLLDTMIFLAFIVAIAVFVYCCCRISIKLALRHIRDDRHAQQQPTYSHPSGSARASAVRPELPRTNRTSASSHGTPRREEGPINSSERRSFLEQALPEHRYSRTTDGGKVDSNSCAICLDDYSTDDIVCRSFNRQCNHLFHRDCILDWLMHDDTCPCCRQPFLEFYDAPDDNLQGHQRRDGDVEMGLVGTEQEDNSRREGELSGDESASRDPEMNPSFVPSGSLPCVSNVTPSRLGDIRISQGERAQG